jgi:hypothetical protein
MHLQESPDPTNGVVDRSGFAVHARCRFRTSDILLVRQALYR